MFKQNRAYYFSAAMVVAAYGIVLAALLFATPAKPAAYGSIGPGGMVIITSDGQVFGSGSRAPSTAGSDTPARRLQFEYIEPEPKRWNPEPETCPRGVKVLRYGSWGC